jgi:branched-chain amino acid transport system substrate-binding protein
MFLAGSVNAQAKPVVKIGWIGPLTGDATYLGVDSLQILRDRIELANSGQSKLGELPFVIKLLAEDDQYSTKMALSAYNKLRNSEGVQIFVVITYGALVSFSERFARDPVVIIDPLDCDQAIADLSDNIFCIAKKTEDVGAVIAKEALKRGVKSPAFLYAQKDQFIPKVVKSAEATFLAENVKPIFSQGVESDIQDYRDTLVRVRKRKPDALFILGYDGFGLIMKQARQLGMKQQFYSFSSINSPGFKALAGSAIDGAIVVGWSAPRTDLFHSFIEQYKQKYGRGLYLEVGSVPTYDTADIIIAQLAKQSWASQDASLDIQEFQSALYQVRGYQGISGEISIDPDGAVRTLRPSIAKFVGSEVVQNEN